MAIFWAEVSQAMRRRSCSSKTGYGKDTRFTTATACRSAVTGVGATPAEGSQSCTGNMAALAPKPKNIRRNEAPGCRAQCRYFRQTIRRVRIPARPVHKNRMIPTNCRSPPQSKPNIYTRHISGFCPVMGDQRGNVTKVKSSQNRYIVIRLAEKAMPSVKPYVIV